MRPNRGADVTNAPRHPTHIWTRGLPNNMISSFLRSTRNLSSVHSGSRGCGPLRSSSDPGRGESALRSLLEPWSDCGKYPDKESHWAAMTLRYSFSRGRLSAEITEQHAARSRLSEQLLGRSFTCHPAEKSSAPPSEPPLWVLQNGSELRRDVCQISVFGAFRLADRKAALKGRVLLFSHPVGCGGAEHQPLTG